MAENFGKSYGLGGGKEFILEGDEYDSAFFDKGPKFLHYRPDEADHHVARIRSRRYLRRPRGHRAAIPAAGESGAAARAHRLLGRERHGARAWSRKAFCPVETYGFGGDSDWIAGDIEFIERRHAISRRAPGRGTRAHSSCRMAGRHNVLNALAAIAIAMAAASRAKPSKRRCAHFAAWRGACKFAAKRAASPWWTISRIIPRPFAPPSRRRARAGRGGVCGWRSSRARTPCGGTFSRSDLAARARGGGRRRAGRRESRQLLVRCGAAVAGARDRNACARQGGAAEALGRPRDQSPNFWPRSRARAI